MYVGVVCCLAKIIGYLKYRVVSGKAGHLVVYKFATAPAKANTRTTGFSIEPKAACAFFNEEKLVINYYRKRATLREAKINKMSRVIINTRYGSILETRLSELIGTTPIN